MTRELKVVGKSIPLIHADAIVTGRQIYASDRYDIMQNALVAKVLRSPYPHAKIKKIDTRKAEALSGVKAVITYKDLPDLCPHHYQDYAFEGPALSDTVRFVGDEVAAVAALDEETALQAIDLIEVEYEKLPFVLDVMEAMQPGAPVVRDNVEHNVCPGESWQSISSGDVKGDIDQGFAEADTIVEDTFTTPNIYPGNLEPFTCVAWWQGDKVNIYITHQSPFPLQAFFATGLGNPYQ